MPPKKRTGEIADKKVTNSSKKGTDNKSVDQKSADQKSVTIGETKLKKDLPKIPEERYKIPEEEITTDDPSLKLLNEKQRNNLRVASAKLHPKTCTSVHEDIKDHASKIISKHAENCENMGEYFSPELLKNDLNRLSFAKLTNSMKSATSKIIDEVKNDNLIISPEAVNLVEVNQKMKDGYEEDVKIRTKLENQSNLRKDKNSDLGFERNVFVSKLQSERRTHKAEVPDQKSFYTEVNYINSSMPDKDIEQAKDDYLKIKAERFSNNMVENSKLTKIRYEKSYKNMLIKQKELEQIEKLKEIEEHKERQEEIIDNVKKRINDYEEQRITEEGMAKMWKLNNEKNTSKFLRGDRLDSAYQKNKIKALQIKKYDPRSYLERRNLRENSKFNLQELKEHSNKYLSSKATILQAKDLARLIDKEKSKIFVKKLKDQMKKWERNNQETNIELDESDEPVKREELRQKARFYSQSIAEKHEEQYEVDPEVPTYQTDYLKKMEVKKGYIDKMEEKRQKNAEDGQKYIISCKKLGNKIFDEKNKAKRELEEKAQNSVPSTPQKNYSNIPLCSINGQSVPNYLEELSKHNQEKKKDLVYWQNKIKNMTKLSQDDLETVVKEIGYYDKKANQLIDIVDTNSFSKNVLNDYNVKKLEDQNDIVDDMHFRSIEAKLMLMNKGTEYMPGYNSKMTQSKSSSQLNRVHYIPKKRKNLLNLT